MSYGRASELIQEAIHEVGGPRRVAAAGLACAAAIVLAIGAYRHGSEDGPGVEVPLAAEAGAAGAAADGGMAAAGAASEASRSARMLLVHVAGAVRRPGLVRLQDGARVADAIRAAGGAAPGADVSALNLAAALADADKVHVPKRGEVEAGGLAAGLGGAGGAAGAEGAREPVDLNTAGVAELDALPGIGPVLAQRIVDHRAANGRFRSVDDLRQVGGIGPKKFEQLKPLLAAR